MTPASLENGGAGPACDMHETTGMCLFKLELSVQADCTATLSMVPDTEYASGCEIFAPESSFEGLVHRLEGDLVEDGTYGVCYGAASTCCNRSNSCAGTYLRFGGAVY
jgi:hypothetical protein